jgi:putative ABC transport system substrate-binding protein
MRLIGLAVLFTIGLLAAPLAAGAQQAGRVYRIGVLTDGDDPANKPFLNAMREFGWVEGQNLTIERRLADSRDKLPVLAAELVELKVDLMLTNGTPATLAAKEVTKTIPIVFNLGADPVASGLVASFAKPGGNVTGWVAGIYDSKLLAVLKEAVPRVSRVAYPATSGGPSSEDFDAAVRALGVKVQGIPVKGPEDFDSFFAGAKRMADAALVPNVAWFGPHLERLGAAAAKSRLPAIGFDRRFAESGGLLSHGLTRPLQHNPRRAAQVDRILRGATPADLPVERPTKVRASG